MVYLLTLSHMPNFNTLSHQTVKKHSHDCLVILHSIDILTHSFPMSCRTLLQGHRVNFLVSLTFQKFGRPPCCCYWRRIKTNGGGKTWHWLIPWKSSNSSQKLKWNGRVWGIRHTRTRTRWDWYFKILFSSCKEGMRADGGTDSCVSLSVTSILHSGILVLVSSVLRYL